MIPPIGYKLCISNVIPRATSNKAIRNTLKKKKHNISKQNSKIMFKQHKKRKKETKNKNIK